MYLSGTQKLFFFTVTLCSMLLGYFAGGLEGFLGGFVLSSVFLLWCRHRIQSSRPARMVGSLQSSKTQSSTKFDGVFDRQPPTPTFDFEWDPNIKLPLESQESGAQKAYSPPFVARQPMVRPASADAVPDSRDILEPHL